MHFIESITTLTHHAYALIGAKVEHLLVTLEGKHDIQIKANPDFFHEKYESLGIDESRRIKEIHTSKSFISGSKRIFIIECRNITHEAQNALLKIFEEPHEHTHFFIIMPSISTLLPTLRSRLFIIESSREDIESGDIEKFLKLSPKDKVAFVDDLAKKISDEELEKGSALDFLARLEVALYKKGIEKNEKGLKAILKARDYMTDRSSSVKQLLEFVALTI